VIRKQ